VNDRTLLPGEYAVLCLLSLRPMHGYEMLCFLGDEGLDAVCPVEQSTLYTYLRNVESRHLVTWSEERVGLRPPRKMYELTDEGGGLIHDWLRRPVERLREVRLEFLLKLYFLDATDRGALRKVLAEQIAVCEEYLVQVEARPQESPFRRLVAQSKSSAAEATLSWLKSYAYELEREVAR
jgi:PadR family transcriptional regulator, regulatory protein AphA